MYRLVRKRPRVGRAGHDVARRRGLSRDALFSKAKPEEQQQQQQQQPTATGADPVAWAQPDEQEGIVLARRAVSTCAARADQLRTRLFDSLLHGMSDMAASSELAVSPASIHRDRLADQASARDPPQGRPRTSSTDSSITLLDKQILLEERSVQDAVDRYNAQLKGAICRGDVGNMPLVKRLILSWYPNVSMVLSRCQRDPGAAEISTSSKNDPALAVLHMLDPDTLAVIAIHEALADCLSRDLDDKKSATFVRIAKRLARAVRAELDFQNIAELRKAHNKRKSSAKDCAFERDLVATPEFRNENRLVESVFNTVKPPLTLINSVAKRSNVAHQQWDEELQMQVGAYLIRAVVQECKVVLHHDGAVEPCLAHNDTQGVSAFEHDHFMDHGKSHGEVRVRSQISSALIHSDEVLADIIPPRHKPMLVSPKPWTGLNNGGYLRSKACLLKHHPEPNHLSMLDRASMSTVFQGLNVLGSQAWKVNPPVLHAVERLWKQGGGIAGIVPRNDKDKEKHVPCQRVSSDPQVKNQEFIDALRARRATRALSKENRERNSLRWDTKYRIDQATEFATNERIYLPHSIDFRGRAYPIPAHLQHMGADLCRGLLTFASPGRPLGRRGVFWLKVHLANLLGCDKLDFDGRIGAAENAIPRVIATAKDPYCESSLDFWTAQEDPFQFLAVCHEIEQAARFGSPAVSVEDTMAQFESTLPIQVDGSCNGLQHYAALGRDVEGGRQVNLVPSDYPMDVYSGVAERVAIKVASDKAAGDKCADLLAGRISRKIVKQTVMTSVYGVTRNGARDQIQNRLKELSFLSEEDLWRCSHYLSKVTLTSLGDLFLGATRTMDWLAICAQNIARIDEPVQWTTPLGLPVSQSYRLSEKSLIRTVVQKVSLRKARAGNPVDKGRQRSAFPPNYIHSLDSSHMLMTAVKCAEAGLNFASVHDSFWTNAADVDTMNQVLREEFVALHSRNLLDDLMVHFRVQYGSKGVDIPDLPERGNLCLSDVLKSDYFFA